MELRGYRGWGWAVFQRKGLFLTTFIYSNADQPQPFDRFQQILRQKLKVNVFCWVLPCPNSKTLPQKFNELNCEVLVIKTDFRLRRPNPWNQCLRVQNTTTLVKMLTRQSWESDDRFEFDAGYCLKDVCRSLFSFEPLLPSVARLSDFNKFGSKWVSMSQFLILLISNS